MAEVGSPSGENVRSKVAMRIADSPGRRVPLVVPATPNNDSPGGRLADHVSGPSPLFDTVMLPWDATVVLSESYSRGPGRQRAPLAEREKARTDGAD